MTNDELKQLHSEVVRITGSSVFLMVVAGHGIYRFDRGTISMDQTKDPTSEDLYKLEMAIGNYLHKNQPAKVIQLYPQEQS